ncbi:MAG: MFS transporter [Bacillota bacterium]
MGDATTIELKNSYKWWALAAVAVGTFMGPLDSSVVNIAMPTFSAFFKVPVTTVEWVATSYLLVISSLLLTYGRLGDLYGHKPIYIAGFVVFTLGSVLAGLSHTISLLIAFRVFQALGAGMMMAIGPAIVTASFPPSERGKALGMLGMTVAIGSAVGPVLGGYLVHAFGWRSIFFINLPVGIFGILWAWRVLIWDRSTRQQSFDVPGSALLFGAIFFLLLGLSKGSDWGWSSVRIVALFVTSALLGLFFVFTELRQRDPMMDLSLFRNKLFTMASLSALLNFMAITVVIFLMPFYLQDIRMLDTSRAGLIMLAFPAAIFVVAPIAGALSDRIGSRTLSSTGMAVLTCGIFLLSRLGPVTPFLHVILPLMIIGLGSALFQSPNSSAILGSVPKNRLGIGAGMLASMRNIGMVIGTAISATVYDARIITHTRALINQGLQGLSLRELALSNALDDAYLVGSLLAFIGIITSLSRGRKKYSNQD